MIKVLFVCHGNICRSPMAEFVMKDLLEKQNYETLLNMGWELVIAFFIGGALLTAIMTPITYIFVKRLVVAFQKKQNAKNEKIKGKTL